MQRDEITRLTRGGFTKRVFRHQGQWLSPSATRTLQRQWVTPLKRRLVGAFLSVRTFSERLWKYLHP